MHRAPAICLVVWLYCAGNSAAAEPDAPKPEKLPVVERLETASGTLLLGQPVTVLVANLEKSTTTDPRQLVLYLNGLPLKGLTPYAVDRKEGRLFYRLRKSENSGDVWSGVLTGAVAGVTVAVSVGPEGGPPFESHVTSYHFTAINRNWVFYATVIGFIALTALFVWLAISSDILRDSVGPVAPHARRPYSLGRSQMAFWFFLVLASWLYIWIVTQQRTNLSPTVLGLMGISAGTALGAVLINSGKTQAANDRFESLTSRQAGLLQAIAALNTQSAAQPANAKELNEQLTSRSQELAEVNALLANQPVAQPAASSGFLFDILSDDKGIALHRFQIAVWTVVLGFVVTVMVLNTLSMPDIDPTLLTLMGISSAAYLGFKFPEPVP